MLGGQIAEATKDWSLASGAIGVQLAEKFDEGALASIAQGKGAILAGQLMPKLASENALKRWSIRPFDSPGGSEKLEAWMRPGSLTIGKSLADRASISNFPTLLDQISGRINEIAGAGKTTLLQDQLSSGALASIAQGKGAILAGQLMPKLASENALKRWSSVSAADWMERLWRVPALFQRMERAERELAVVDPTGARLAVLLRHVGIGRAVEMLELMVSSGPAPLIAVLAEIVLDPPALKAFEVAVEAACLSSQAENDLMHALEHLGEGDSDRAFPPLLTGLEGALRDAVRARGDRKKRSNARALAAVLSLDKDHQLLIGEIYSEVNDGRHGNELDRHAACVLALIGLTIWMDECLDKPAVEWLGRELDHRLTKRPALAA